MQPGWFPDPHNPRFVRYWDGAAWTSHVTVATPSQGPPPSPYDPVSPRGRKSSAPLIIGIIAAAAVVIGVLSWLVIRSDTYQDVTDTVREEIDQPATRPANDAACKIERRTIRTAFEAYYATTGHYPTSYDDVTAPGPTQFLEESPAARWTFSPDPNAYANGTQGIGRCEGF